MSVLSTLDGMLSIVQLYCRPSFAAKSHSRLLQQHTLSAALESAQAAPDQYSIARYIVAHDIDQA